MMSWKSQDGGVRVLRELLERARRDGRAQHARLYARSLATLQEQARRRRDRHDPRIRNPVHS